MAIKYTLPENWIKYDLLKVVPALTDAKAAVMSLTSLPYQRSWAEDLQELELKREVAGTSRIEGADFTERELDEAISEDAETRDFTRSQRQARAAVITYRWISTLPKGRPIDAELAKEIHRRIVTDCDDDHCQPGALRGTGENVTFGRPQHRGIEGGSECSRGFNLLFKQFNSKFKNHDPLVQALALHYHLGAMHPFLDGNGRTARALEALVLGRADLKDTLFVSMSNYYYDEKDRYLSSLSTARQNNHDLTDFLVFGLMGIAQQCRRLLKEVTRHVEKSLFRDVMSQMYARLMSTRKRALAKRQMAILDKLLDLDREVEFQELYTLLEMHYAKLKSQILTYSRDLNHLSSLRAINVRQREDDRIFVSVRLEWGTEITRTSFYESLETMPKAKTRLLLSPKTGL